MSLLPSCHREDTLQHPAAKGQAAPCPPVGVQLGSSSPGCWGQGLQLLSVPSWGQAVPAPGQEGCRRTHSVPSTAFPREGSWFAAQVNS